MPFLYLSHTFPIPFLYLSHTPLILSSYSPHTLLILSSYSPHTLFIHNSYTPHTLLIHSSYIFRECKRVYEECVNGFRFGIRWVTGIVSRARNMADPEKRDSPQLSSYSFSKLLARRQQQQVNRQNSFTVTKAFLGFLFCSRILCSKLPADLAFLPVIFSTSFAYSTIRFGILFGKFCIK